MHVNRESTSATVAPMYTTKAVTPLARTRFVAHHNINITYLALYRRLKVALQKHPAIIFSAGFCLGHTALPVFIFVSRCFIGHRLICSWGSLTGPLPRIWLHCIDSGCIYWMVCDFISLCLKHHICLQDSENIMPYTFFDPWNDFVSSGTDWHRSCWV